MNASNKDVQSEDRYPGNDNRNNATIQDVGVLPVRRACSTLEKVKRNESQKKVIKFRAKLPKVKTGCHNCKIRRIKCDETMPGCVRCFKFGILCSGYPRQPDKIKLKSRPIAPILPKGLVFGPQFTEELESRYFGYFCEDVASGISGPLSTGLWSEIIPQICEIEPYIAHGLVSLSAFSKYRKEMIDGHESSSTNKHLEYALTQYGKSLRGMQKAMHENAGRCPRTALIACILVFCIESLQGHQASASAHATNGMMMLWDFINLSPTDTDFAKENSIGPELQRAAADLDLQVLHFLDTRPTAHHIMVKEHLNRYRIRQTLPSFQNLSDCSEYLQAIMGRNLHFSFINIARRAKLDHDLQEQSEAFSPKSWEDAVDLKRSNCSYSQVEEPGGDFPPEMLHECETYLADMVRWEEASAEIFQKCMTYPHNSEEFLTAALLKAHAAASTVHLHSSFYKDEIQYDQLEPYFHTIVTYCSFVHPFYSTSSYHTNLGIMMPLFEVGMHCRNKILRDQAIAMTFMNKYYREGVWDSYVGGFICKWIRDLEESWRDVNGHIPADRRAKITGLNAVVGKRRAQIFCTQRAGPGGGSVAKDTIVTW